ncbi:hypothetical protein I4U23_024847 [Adineta vaga]|nr:hypothetical protein I4U23_024847 [Adineta vaga]
MQSLNIHQLDNTKLLEKINKINKENDTIRRENLLFSRYLLRTNSSKVVKTFDDYEYEDENEILYEILHQTKSSDNTRRRTTKKVAVGWTKVHVDWSEQGYTQYISSIEKERFIIAAYEAKQTRLEWERMNAKATAIINNSEVLFQSIESDEIAQDTLNRELSRRVDRYRADIGEEEFNNPYMHVPGELVVSRVNKRIHSRISLIGLIRVNTACLHIRIDEINDKIRLLDDFNDKMDEIDITSMRTRKIDNSDIYERVDRKFRKEKSFQYPLFRQLQEYKKILNEQETNIHDMEKKCELLRNYLERIMFEIKDIQREYEIIWKESNFLKNRMADVRQVPSITNYAHIMKQTIVLQHEIDIWTQRVTTAETLLVQLERQEKPPRRLPSLRSNTTDRN